MSESFPLIILKTIHHKVFIFHIVICHDFGVTGSKVKVAGSLNVRIVSADYLGNYLSQSLHISHTDWS
jgi:hypothetical protein